MRTLDYTTEELCVAPRLRIALVTETWAPEVNGVAMTLGRMVDGLIRRGHSVQLIRPRQARGDIATHAEGLEEVLSRGLRLPRYDGLKLGQGRLEREGFLTGCSHYEGDRDKTQCEQRQGK